jgi:hypothetical protein
MRHLPDRDDTIRGLRELHVEPGLDDRQRVVIESAILHLETTKNYTPPPIPPAGTVS